MSSPPSIKMNPRPHFIYVYIFSIPKLLFRLGISNPVGQAMLKIVKETFENREKHGIVRKDMMQLLMQLRNTGAVDEDDSKPFSLEKTDDGKD